LVFAGCLGGCQANNVGAETAALTLAPENLAQHQMEMRQFDTKDEARVLSACAGLLQDLGFSIDDGSAKTAFLVASKDRGAIEAQQVAGQMLLVALAAAAGARADPVYDQKQRIRISIVTSASATGTGTIVRATFQRVIWNNKNQISRVETIDEPAIYLQFFEKLSQALFLEAHGV
jgi:hypothetical protein